MNGTCAGGTGAFIDQMSSLLKTDAQGLNELAKAIRLFTLLHLDVVYLLKLIYSL